MSSFNHFNISDALSSIEMILDACVGCYRWDLYNVSGNPLESWLTVSQRPMNFSLWRHMLANDDPTNTEANLAFKPNVFIGFTDILISVQSWTSISPLKGDCTLFSLF